MQRTVLITGGSRGIGRTMVSRFVKEGYIVWFTYRSGRVEAETLLTSLPQGTARAFEFEQGNWQSHERLLTALPGPVDILINNAALGTGTVTHYVQEHHRQDEALLQVNALGPLWLIQALVPGMKERGYGKLIQISSVDGGIAPFPGFRQADGMSKAALTFMSRQLAVELVHSPVDVFTICPGATATDMFESSTLSRLPPTMRAAFMERMPKSRLIRTEELAELAIFLCRDEASILHGAVLDASLGLGLTPHLVEDAKRGNPAFLDKEV